MEQQEVETVSQATTGPLAPVVRRQNTAQNRYEYRLALWLLLAIILAVIFFAF